MSDITFVERVVESSPAIVLVLLAACTILWRQLRTEIESCRELHERSIESNAALRAAIERLAERIEEAR